ncbi:hypothetical protein MKX03_014093 [Papaver bracteatum]|nr:hypothetical protein MKX03_014093 [Papaver bracteatum]
MMSTAFVILAVLASECSSSKESDDIVFAKVRVNITNDMSQHTLTIHCKSDDDDLGEHALSYGQSFHWHFRIDYFLRTLFTCDMWWNDSSGKLVKGNYDIYQATRDWKRCRRYCSFPVRTDGVYGFMRETQTFVLVYPWSK